jgi:hypothetical protein
MTCNHFPKRGMTSFNRIFSLRSIKYQAVWFSGKALDLHSQDTPFNLSRVNGCLDRFPSVSNSHSKYMPRLFSARPQSLLSKSFPVFIQHYIIRLYKTITVAPRGLRYEMSSPAETLGTGLESHSRHGSFSAFSLCLCYSAVADLHTLQITTTHTKSSHSAVSSPVVPW